MKGLITPDVVYEIGSPTAATISPDGIKAVYAISRPDREPHKYNNTLWMMDLDGDNASKPIPSRLL